MKIKIKISINEGASEYGETWSEFAYEVTEINPSLSGENTQKEKGWVKVIDVEGIPVSLKQDFPENLQRHLNNNYINFWPENFHTTAIKVKNTMVYSHANFSSAYTHGAVQGLFINLKYIKDPAAKVSQYLTAEEGRMLAASTKQSRLNANEAVECCSHALK